jgi:hypothetical protein
VWSAITLHIAAAAAVSLRPPMDNERLLAALKRVERSQCWSNWALFSSKVHTVSSCAFQDSLSLPRVYYKIFSKASDIAFRVLFDAAPFAPASLVVTRNSI